MVSRLRIASGLAVIAAVTLTLELVLIRAFDAMMNAEMSYLIITCAMFSFGLSGVYASLRPLPPDGNPDRYISRLAAAFGLFTLLLLPLFNLNPFNYSELTSHTGVQAIYFAFMYLTLMVPFFLSGLIFTTVFSSYARDIRTLYSFDLCGAAIGSVIFIPFIPAFGPGGLMFIAAAFSFLAAALFAPKLGRAEKALIAIGLVVAAAPIVRRPDFFDFDAHEDKREVLWAKQHDMVETTRWDPVAKIEVVTPKPRQNYSFIVGKNGSHHELFKHVAYDGGEQSSRFYHFDGNLRRLRKRLERDPSLFADNFWNRSVAAAHWFRADSESNVLIIGSAGGQETKAALLYNPRSVDTVEMVKAVVDLAKNEYSEYIGDIFKDPRVRAHVGEGRTYIRRSGKKFDIIQIFSNHVSSSMAGGGGAGRGVYLQTVEAYREYFGSLNSEGILAINHHFYPRLIATAAAAWKQTGRGDFRKHVLVYERKGVDTIPFVAIKMTPWAIEEVDKLNHFMLPSRATKKNRDRFRLVEDPLHPEAGFLSDEFYSGSLSSELIARVPYRITAPTDDQPYFNFVRKRFADEEVDPPNFVSPSIAGMLNSQMADKQKVGKLPFGIPLDVAHYVLSGVVSLVFGLLFVLVPLLSRAKKRERWPGELTSLLYFSCLGAGFIIVELTLAPVFIKLIGIPLHTYSTVIFTMLGAAGLGSNAANSLRVSPGERWWLPYVGVIASGLLLLATYPVVFGWFLASPMAVRILVAGVMVFPISFWMGMCLPLGILAIEQKPRGAIAWAWGMNGLFTTIGGIAAAVVSMYWGFRSSLLLALLSYVLAGLTFMRLKRFCAGGEAQPAVPSAELRVEA